MTYWVGIDVGKYGAIAVIDDSGPLMYRASESSWKETGKLLASLKDQITLAALEHTRAIPGVGGNGLIAFGSSFGGYQALLEYIEIPFILLPSVKWQKKMLGTFPAGESKLRAADYIRRRFPKLELTKNKKKNEGIIDAMCIALYVKDNH